MKGMVVFGLVLLALWIISLIRVGVEVYYTSAGTVVRVRVGFLHIQLLPRKKKDKPAREKRQRKRAAKQEQPEPPAGSGGPLSTARQYLPLICEAAGRLRRQIRVDHIDLAVTWSASDPARAAMGYGYCNAALGMMWPLIENNFNVKDRHIRTALDFNAEQPALSLFAALSLSIRQFVVMGAVLGVRFLKVYRANKAATADQVKQES